MVVRGGRWWWAAVFVCRSGTFRSSRRGAVGGRAGLRTGSGCRPGLRAPGSLQGEEGVGDRDQGDVVVPAGVAAALEVVEAERVFEFSVVVFDAPANLREGHELAQGRV